MATIIGAAVKQSDRDRKVCCALHYKLGMVVANGAGSVAGMARQMDGAGRGEERSHELRRVAIPGDLVSQLEVELEGHPEIAVPMLFEVSRRLRGALQQLEAQA